MGGVWRVEGGYSFYAATKHGLAQSYLVDTHPTETVRKLAAKYPSVSLVKGNFGDAGIAERVTGADGVFFFDVLLHQVSPNWDEILKLYSSARVLVIFNQQWTGAETVRLPDLGEEEYFRNVPHWQAEEPYTGLFSRLHEEHPDHPGRPWRDVHHIWQWGITDLDLIRVATGLGYKLDYFENYGPFMDFPQFEDHGFLFVK